jgi:ABC-type transport system involved in cytochrome bd biosynthesis fused ATPase/permease subunit
MNGVEILNTIPITEPGLLYILIPLVIALIGIIVSYRFLDKEQDNKAFFTWGFALLLSIIVAVVMLQVPWIYRPTGEYTYEIRTTEECKFNEFNSKYEILEEKENNIYIVREKTIEK